MNSGEDAVSNLLWLWVTIDEGNHTSACWLMAAIRIGDEQWRQGSPPLKEVGAECRLMKSRS